MRAPIKQVIRDMLKSQVSESIRTLKVLFIELIILCWFEGFVKNYDVFVVMNTKLKDHSQYVLT